MNSSLPSVALIAANHVDGDVGSVRAVSRAFDVLRILALGGEHGMRLVDVVAYAQLSRPTVHRILHTLIAEGVAEQEPATRRYRVGPEISLLGMSRPAQLPVRAAAEPHLTELAETLGDTMFLTVRAGWDSVAIVRKTGSYPIKVLAIDVGARRPLGVGMAGVMLLAAQEPEQIEAICRANTTRLPADGPDMAMIRQRVQRARERGYAYADAGVMQGTRALAVPVRDANGEVVAAITVAAMADRLSESTVPRVLETLQERSCLVTQRLHEMQPIRAAKPSRLRMSKM